MARIRSIKPEFFTSLTIANLDLPARLTFIGLWTHCDDEGRCVDDARLIKAAIWPLDDRTAADVEEDLGALSESSLITRYEVAGRRYLTVCGWAEHQRINRATKSKYPGPDQAESNVTELPASGNESSEATHGGLSEDSVRTHDRKGTGNREQGKEEPPSPAAPAEADASGDGVLIHLEAAQKKPTFQPGSDQDPAFVAFWKAYPRKVDKGHARAAWVKAIKRADPQAIVTAAQRFRDNPMRQARGTEYTPHPTTWLNGERWNDDTTTAPDDHWRWDAVQEVAPREFNHR